MCVRGDVLVVENASPMNTRVETRLESKSDTTAQSNQFMPLAKARGWLEGWPRLLWNE
jgi:hypothetical protein